MNGIVVPLLVLAGVLAWMQTHGGVAPLGAAVLSTNDPVYDKKFIFAIATLILAAMILPDSIAIPAIGIIALGAGLTIQRTVSQ